jgi:hypothetical protein
MNIFFGKLLGSVLISIFAFTSIASAQDITQTPDLNVTGVTVTETTGSSVTLAWDANSNAATYTIEYGTEAVVEQGDTYNQPPEEADTNQITIENLNPNTTYYFSIVAFNDGKTSASQEYSEEVTATTSSLSTNFDIVGLEVINAGAIEVELTEPVILPENAKDEILINLLENPSETLNVIEVTIKETENNVLVINTEAQSPDTNYVLELNDAFENASAETIPETRRTQSFTGYNAADSDTTAGAMTGLKLDAVKALDINGMNVVEIDFNAELELDESDLSSFTIVKSNDPNQFLEIKEIKPNNQDKSKYLLVTAEQELTTYSLILTALESTDGQSVSDDNSIVEFQGIVIGTEEVNEESDEIMLNNLRVTTSENTVTVLWDEPSSDANVTEVKIYLSTDKGNTFNEVKSGINPVAKSTTIENINVGTDNQLKISLVIDGTETEGQIIDFELAETGPAISLALVLMFAVAGSYVLKRRNQFALEDHFLG